MVFCRSSLAWKLVVIMEETFKWGDKNLQYADYGYNSTRINERCVEIPVAEAWMSRDPKLIGLEVGNVLSHYHDVNHRIVDRYEVAVGVDNIDVFDISETYDWILAISTLEHVRWDEKPRQASGSVRALNHLHSLLNPSGKMLVTIPMGYQPFLDREILSGTTGATKSYTYTRSDLDVNVWLQDDSIKHEPYGVRTDWASSVWFGEFDHIES